MKKVSVLVILALLLQVIMPINTISTFAGSSQFTASPEEIYFYPSRVTYTARPHSRACNGTTPWKRPN